MKNFKGYLKGFTLLAIFLLLIVLTGCSIEETDRRIQPVNMVPPTRPIMPKTDKDTQLEKDDDTIKTLSTHTNDIPSPETTSITYLYIRTKDEYASTGSNYKVLLFITKNLKVQNNFIEWNDSSGYHQHFLVGNQIIHASNKPLDLETQRSLFNSVIY